MSAILRTKTKDFNKLNMFIAISHTLKNAAVDTDLR